MNKNLRSNRNLPMQRGNSAYFYFKKQTALHIILLLGLTLTSCVSLLDPETSQEFNNDSIGIIKPGETIGQTFISRRPRLDGITLWMDPDSSGASLTIELFYSPTDQIPIFTTTTSILPGPNRIAITPQTDPANQPYYFQLRTNQGATHIFGRDEDTYPYGQAYLDEQPLEGDLAFRASYDYDWRAALSDLGDWIATWKLVIPLGVLLLLPGFLILEAINFRENLDPGEQIAISVGMSITIIPVIMLWATTLGFRWGRTQVWFAAGMMVAWLGWLLGSKGKISLPKVKTTELSSSRFLSTVILIAIFMASSFVRFAMVRDLTTPSWVDSVHHSLITERIVEFGGFPDNYLPHIPLEASRYHPGYHSILATFHWLTGLEIPQAMLILGQVLNALSVFMIYAFTSILVKDKKAALIAALITGLASLMPAYYTSWGRYTQLTGLLVIPAGLTWITASTRSNKGFLPILMGGFTMAGLFIVHYRVTLFLLCLIVSSWIGGAYPHKKNIRHSIVTSIKAAVFQGILGVTLVLPWFVPTWRGYIKPALSNLSSGAQVFQEIHWRYHTPVLGIPILILAVMGLTWGIIKRRDFVITIFVWIILLFVVANPGYFHIPFPQGLVNQVSVEIVLFIPISVLGGYGVGEALSGIKSTLPSLPKWIRNVVVLLIGIGISALGVQKLLPTLNPVTNLTRQADLPAMDWIRENIPTDEIIVINPTGWGYGLYMGADGGFWISALTGRITVPPNVLYGLDINRRSSINQFIEQLLPAAENADKIHQLLEYIGSRYIFIGGRGGIISPAVLLESPLFSVRYHQDGVWIFEKNEIP